MPTQFSGTPGQTAAQVTQQIAGAVTSSRLYTQMTVQPGDTLTATTTAEQSYASGVVIPANSLVVGQEMRVRGAGIYTTTAVLPPTQRARLRFGGQVMVDSGPLSMPVSLSSCRYTFDISMMVRATGTNGSIEAFGQLVFATSLTTAIVVLGGPSGAVGEAGNPVGSNTTVDMPLGLTCTFGAVLAGNSNSLRQLSIHTLKPAA